MKTAVKIVVCLVAAVIVLKLFFFVFGMVTMLAWALASLLIIAAIIYFLFPQLFNQAATFIKGEAQPSSAEIRLWDADGKVTLFLDKPNLKQIANPKSDSASLLQLPNDTIVEVLADESDADPVVKIKIRSGDKRGTFGWVERGAVRGYQRSLPRKTDN